MSPRSGRPLAGRIRPSQCLEPLVRRATFSIPAAENLVFDVTKQNDIVLGRDPAGPRPSRRHSTQSDVKRWEARIQLSGVDPVSAVRSVAGWQIKFGYYRCADLTVDPTVPTLGARRLQDWTGGRLGGMISGVLLLPDNEFANAGDVPMSTLDGIRFLVATNQFPHAFSIHACHRTNMMHSRVENS